MVGQDLTERTSVLQNKLARLIVASFSAVTLGLLPAAVADAQDALAAGRQAEEAGNVREAVGHYTVALQATKPGSAEELQLRERIINLVKKIDPKPAVPEEARRYAVYDMTALREARQKSDNERAARELEQASRLAPWWADVYVNLGIVYGNTENYEAAIRSLKLYLLAAPGAPDAQAVQTKIYEFEYKQRTYAAAERLRGMWAQDQTDNPASRACLRARGNDFEILLGDLPCESGERIYRGTIDGLRIVGMAANRALYYRTRWTEICKQMPKEIRMTGEIAPDWNMITLRFEELVPRYTEGVWSRVDCKSFERHPQVIKLYRE